MDAVTFEIDPESSDFQLLEMLLRSDEYDHSCACPRPSSGQGIHGPYSLDSIAALSFEAIEFVSINRSTRKLHLLVASDD